MINNFNTLIFGKQVDLDTLSSPYAPQSLRVDSRGNFHLIDTSKRSTWKGRIISLIQYFVYGSSHKANDRALCKAIDHFENAIIKTACNNPLISLDNACKTVEIFKADPDFSKDSKIVNKIADFQINTLTKLAEKGNIDAQYKLALCCRQGKDCDENKTQAFFWMKEAADQGHLRAQNNLGSYYLYGIGTPKDKDMAIEYYGKAAKEGDAFAQCNLAGCYEKGVGVVQNKQEAIKWHQLAADQGHEKSNAALKRLQIA